MSSNPSHNINQSNQNTSEGEPSSPNTPTEEFRPLLKSPQFQMTTTPVDINSDTKFEDNEQVIELSENVNTKKNRYTLFGLNNEIEEKPKFIKRIRGPSNAKRPNKAKQVLLIQPLNASRKITNQFMRSCYWALDKCARAAARVVKLPLAFPDDGETNRPKLIDKTFWIFGPNNPLRLASARTFRFKYIELFLLLVILLHWFVMATETFEYEKRERWTGVRQMIKVGIFTIYTIEALMRMIVGGVWYDCIQPASKSSSAAAPFSLTRAYQQLGYRALLPPVRSAYLRSSYSRMDPLSIASFWIYMIASGIFKYESLYLFQSLSTFRTFRLLEITSGSKVILNSLKKSGPLLGNAIIFILFFMLVFSLFGTLLFRGGLQNRCVLDNGEKLLFERFCGSYRDTDGTILLPDMSSDRATTWLNDRVTKGYSCPIGQFCKKDENPNDGLTSFDDLWHSWIYVFIISSAQSWTPIMYNVINTTNMNSLLFFVVAVIVLNFWLLNLFIAIITDTFANIRETQSSAFTEDKNAGFIILEDTDALSPHPRHMRSKSATMVHLGKFRTQFSSLYTMWNQELEYFFLIVILASLGVMGATTNYMNEEQLRTFYKWELLFTLILDVELLIKLVSQRQLKEFFGSRHNMLDFGLGVINTILIIVYIARPFDEFRYFTFFFILRIYRVVWAIPSVRYFLVAILGNIIPMINMIVFIFSIILLSSIAAMQLFGGLMPPTNGEGEPSFDKFDSLVWSFITLYHLFSGEDWPNILYNSMKALEKYNLTWAGVLFVFLFFGLCNFILTNLFVAVVVENLDMSEIQKRDLQLKQHIRRSDTDPNFVGKIDNTWNPYIYLPSNPKTLQLTDLPNNLQIPFNHKHFHQFLKGYPIDEKETTDHRPSWINTLIHKVDNLYRRATSRKPRPMSDQLTGAGTWSKRFMRQLENNPEFQNVKYSDDLVAEITSKRERKDNYEAQEFHEAHPTYNSSLFIFGKKNPIRTACQTMINSHNHPMYPFSKWTVRWWLKNIYIVVIALSVLLSVYSTVEQSPYNILLVGEDNPVLGWYYQLDSILLVIFYIDFTIRVIADGAFFTHNAYFLNVFNCVDFVVLLLNTIDIIASLGKNSAAEGLGRTLRASRALRVLRIINFFPTAKFTLYAILVSGFRNLFDAASLAMCFMIPWAVYLHNIFIGRFYSCNDGADAIEAVGDCVGNYLLENTGLLVPRVWSNPNFYHFDNFKTSLRILFEVTSGEGWIDLMKTSMKVTGKGLQPQEWASFYNAFIIIVYNFTLSVLILSLFVSVVIDSFARRSGTSLLTAEQRKWKDFESKLRQITPSKLPRSRPKSWIGSKCYDLASAKQGILSRTMTLVYLAIFVILAIEVDSLADRVVEINGKILLGLAAVCWIECGIRIIGLGFSVIFTNWHPLIDFILLVLATLAGLLFVSLPELPFYYIQRYIMLTIALNLIFKIDPIHRLFSTLKSSMNPILNMLLVWFIVLLVYTVAFLQIFSLTKIGKNSDEKIVNFRTFVGTMLNLFRFSQGEGWNGVMYGYTVQAPECVASHNYLDNDCGSPSWAYALFMSFNVISMYIFLNMFVSIVVDCFAYSSQLEDTDTGKKIQLDRNEIRMFKRAWAQFDPARTGYLKLEDLVKFLKHLEEPFDIQIYPKVFSVRNLVTASYPVIPGEILPDENNRKMYRAENSDGMQQRGRLQLNVLNSLVNASKIDRIPERRRVFNRIFHEAHILADENRGVGFTETLLLLVRHTLVDPDESFQIPDLLKHKKIQKLVDISVNSERIAGLFHTISLKKKFRKHLEEKQLRDQQSGKAVLKINTKVTSLQREASQRSPQSASTPLYFRGPRDIMMRPDFSTSFASDDTDQQGGVAMDRFFTSNNSEATGDDLVNLVERSSWRDMFDLPSPDSRSP